MTSASSRRASSMAAFIIDMGFGSSLSRTGQTSLHFTLHHISINLFITSATNPLLHTFHQTHSPILNLQPSCLHTSGTKVLPGGLRDAPLPMWM